MIVRPLKFLGIVLLAVLPLALFAAALIYVKLLFGAIPLQFMSGSIRQALIEGLGSNEVTLGNAHLQRSEGGGLALELTDVALAFADGAQTASAKAATIQLDLSAALSGRVVPAGVVLKGAVIDLSQAGNGEKRADMRSVPQAANASQVEAGGPVGGLPPATGTDVTGDGNSGRALVRLAMDALAQVGRVPERALQLQSVTLIDAVIKQADGSRRSQWSVPRADFFVDRSPTTNVASFRGEGRLLVADQISPFRVTLTGRNNGKSATLVASAANIVPHRLADQVPSIHAFEAVDAPLTIHSELELVQGGSVETGRFDIDIGSGRLLIASLGNLPLVIQSGRLSLLWDAAAGALKLAPSPIQLEGGYLKLAGQLVPHETPGGRKGLELDMWASEGVLSNERGVPPLVIEQLKLKSRIWRDGGATELDAFAFKVGGVEITAHGAIGEGQGGSAMRLAGRLGPISATQLKTAWPAGLAPELRRHVISRLLGGDIKGGRFGLIRTGEGMQGSDRLSLSLEGSDLTFALGDGLPPLQVPSTLLRVEGNALLAETPEAFVATASGKKLSFKALRIAIPDMREHQKILEVSGRGQGAVPVVSEIISASGVDGARVGYIPAGADGKIDAQWRVRLPLTSGVEWSAASIDSKVQITDGRIPDALGKHDIRGATFTLAASEKKVDLKGQVLLAGVLAAVNGQWIIGEQAERQPPLRITTRLDTADRRQLGLELDDLVLGEVPIEVLVSQGRDNQPKVHVNADLTGAELRLDGIAWIKPSGRSAKLGFEISKLRSGQGIELRDFKITGDSLTIDGSVMLGADHKVQSYSFPGFSLNVVTNLQVSGRRQNGRIWEVKARGKTFDATGMIREHFAFDDSSAAKKQSGGQKKGLDLDLAVDTILGLNETSLQRVQLKLSERDDELQSVTMNGTLEGGGRVSVSLPPRTDGRRLLEIDTDNAGQALKLAGVYTSMKGGRGMAILNLDGQGAAERTGQLHVRKFKVIGDPVFYEVLQNADEGRPAIASGSPRSRRQVVREEISFDDVRATFAAGNGQIAVQSLAATGPLVGVSVHGKADFRSQRLSLGGTYIPLSGLNRALSEIPLLREIFTGPKGEGVFGITFGVSGKMSEPQVVVNPFSFIAPGVLREIFQMAPQNPQVTPSQSRRRTRGSPSVRSSQPVTPPGHGDAPPTAPGQVIDGWSLKTHPQQ